MKHSIHVRRADLEDRSAIWTWWNDPDTRQMMKKNAHVPWEEHCRWYKGVLDDPDRILCMGTVADEKLGVVRFTLQFPLVYEVSINLNPALRGKGYAAPFLQECIAYLGTVHSALRLVAGCKKINVPSQKTFRRCGFTFKSIDQPYPSLHAFDPHTELFCERLLRAAS